MVSIADFSGALAERIAKAVEALGPEGGEIVFPPGRYRFDREFTLERKDNITFFSVNATIDGVLARSYFNIENCRNITFDGFHFDTRFGELPRFTKFSQGAMQTAIRFSGSKNLKVIKCKFYRLYTVFIYCHNSSHVEIVNCEFSSLLQDQDQYLSFVEFLTCGGSILLLNNFFYGAPTDVNDKSPAAIAASGISGEMVIAENRVQHCGRNNGGSHRLGCFDLYADTVNVTVRNNAALNCREQFMRISTSVNVTVQDNFVSMAPEVDSTYSTLSIESGSWPELAHPVCRNIVIIGNSFRCTDNHQAFAVGVISYDWGAAAENVQIEANSIEGYDRAIFIAGPFRDLTITRNRVAEAHSFLDVMQSGNVSMTSVLGTERLSSFDGLVVEENEIEIKSTSKSVPVSFSIGRTRHFLGSIGTFSFLRNRLSNRGSNVVIAVSCLFNADRVQGIFQAFENTFRGYAVPFYLRSIKRAMIRGNFADGMTNLYLTDGTVQSLELLGNQQLVVGPP